MIKENLEIPVVGEYDTVVAGGGVAGIAAALAAARKGARTLLLERMFLPGGLATAGLITIYLPLCDGMGNQISFGIVEELLRLSVKHGQEYYDGQRASLEKSVWLGNGTDEEKKKKRFEVQFNANVFAILCEQLLVENGVEILYGTTVCSAEIADDKITAIITENKSGRQAFRAKAFVDATGDADLCHIAGVRTEKLGQGNVICNWYYEHNGSEFRCNTVGTCDIPDKYKKTDKKDDRVRYSGVDGKEISEMMIQSHKDILDSFLGDGEVTREHALANIPVIPSLRMTRRLDGCYVMNDEEKFRYFEDSIGLISDWRRPGPVYEIPFGTLITREVKNLITCGRCISVTDDMWDLTRVIPACAVTGEAAGLAAAMFDDFPNADVPLLQNELRQNGVKIHTDEVLK